ncbi:MAG: site-specific integrase [Lachnospiraceae bacterium]|nr:site-specific integrase [Lachnospiraceae bacterium]
MQYHISPTKTSNTRKIPITERVYEVLCEQRKSYFVYADEYIDGKRNFVFHTQSGKLIKITNFDSELKRVAAVYNETAIHKIDNLSCHILRHTGCTRNAEKGMDMKVLQYMMGHATPNLHHFGVNLCENT